MPLGKRGRGGGLDRNAFCFALPQPPVSRVIVNNVRVGFVNRPNHFKSFENASADKTKQKLSFMHEYFQNKLLKTFVSPIRTV